ncbi:MAG: terminase large subunit domain-containing protein [Acidobacteriaceae bacterium]
MWQPQAGPQTALVTCPVPDVLFGGARGGGKTAALLLDWLYHYMRNGQHARGMILRRSMPQLEEVIAQSKLLYREIGGVYREGIKTWLFPDGATLKMRWLDRDADASNYQGMQFTWLGVDEAGTWQSPDAIDQLRATLRSAAGVPAMLRLTANPGGPGEHWLRERYIGTSANRFEPLIPRYDAEKSVWRVFIPSRLENNTILMNADPTYMDRIRASGPPHLVRAWLEGDWFASAGDSFFDELCWLVDNLPPTPPERLDYVFVTIDTAVKTGSTNDGTAAVYFGYSRFHETPLYILDWDIKQIEGALLEDWMPSVFRRLEELSGEYRARRGSIGAWIEDKYSGSILIQQCLRHGWPAQAIDGKLTALGKDERAINVSGYHWQRQVTIVPHAYNKVVIYKNATRNHFLSQVCGFRIGVKDQADDLLDCYTYGLAAALGNAGYN